MVKTVTIEEAVWKSAKLKATEEGTALKEWIGRAVQAYLARTEKGKDSGEDAEQHAQDVKRGTI